MFYSETLLAKTGPLARVWLASNLERKLTKQNVLSSNLESNVKDIIGTGQAPMALRLSGQLLLGVVRIYSRKARYLLDDCSEALSKIQRVFRPGNVDLPSGQTHTGNPNALMLPDTITEVDLFAPLPDPDELLAEPERRRPGRDPTLLDMGASQLLPDLTPSRREQRQFLLDDDDLGIDLGFGSQGIGSTPALEDPSVEIGRRATPRRDEPTLLDDGDDLGIDLGLGDTTLGADNVIRTADDDMPMLGGEDDYQFPEQEAEIAAANAAALARLDNATARRQREADEESMLSEMSARRVQELEPSFRLNQTAADLSLDDDPTVVQAAQRVKRRRIMQPDFETELHNSQIKKQQEDRSAITKPPSFLPRDPLLLQLMEMQRRGEFVSSIMGDGAMRGWAPELRGIASLEMVKKAGEKKRKRDSGVADMETGSERQTPPRLDLPQDEDEGFQIGGDDVAGFGGDATALHSDGLQIPGLEDDLHPLEDDEPGAPFDTTEAPLLHPSQTGPVSLGTKSAVHLLRSHFAGPDHATNSLEAPTPSRRVKQEAMFTDLCPETTTSRQDATKMFFELLVLGTKDAVKVEQDSKELGLPIRVRGKRGLWGDWAEMDGTSSQQREGGQEVEAAS